MYLIILLIITIVLFFVIVFLSVQLFNICFRGYAPFISTKPKIIANILREINLQPNDKVYELGCGKAGFLNAICKKFPKVKAIGVENAPWPYFLAQIQATLLNKNIKIIRKNLFNINLSDANLIYCYLNLKTMDKLKEKFNKECKSGAIIISYQFPMHNINPQKIIQLDKDKVYFYKIA